MNPSRNAIVADIYGDTPLSVAQVGLEVSRTSHIYRFEMYDSLHRRRKDIMHASVFIERCKENSRYLTIYICIFISATDT